MLGLKDQELARHRRQARVVYVRDDRQQLLHAKPTACRDDPELGHVPCAAVLTDCHFGSWRRSASRNKAR